MTTESSTEPVPLIGWGKIMNNWQSTDDSSQRALPRDLSGYEIEAHFTNCDSARPGVDDERHTPTL